MTKTIQYSHQKHLDNSIKHALRQLQMNRQWVQYTEKKEPDIDLRYNSKTNLVFLLQ